jgi:hypothetical protein
VLPLPQIGSAAPRQVGELLFMTGLGAIAVVGAASVFRWGSARERHLSASRGSWFI